MPICAGEYLVFFRRNTENFVSEPEQMLHIIEVILSSGVLCDLIRVISVIA